MATLELQMNTGKPIPVLGLGTWKAADGDTYRAVLAALESGYRHIDTAAIYRNEAAVGRAIRDSGVPREKIFVTTKLWCTQQRDPQSALNASLERLGLDYVDLYLMHFPVALKTDLIKDGNVLSIPVRADGARDVDIDGWSFVKTWQLMQDLPKSGKTKAIGVSNFSIKNIEEILKPELGLSVPAANQIEIHPQLPQDELIEYCKSKGIIVEAYSPLGSSESSMLTDPDLIKLAEKHQVEPAQILISWGVTRGYCILPKSVNSKRVQSNLKIVKLSSNDVQQISKILEKLGSKRYVSPSWAPFPMYE
ncbi:KLTH0E00220p [Lachancea thermotolerans CBS 6340]|uniref:KLTH0A00528p n=1 Tax=Lachancea thermotolerans (strain ATCC 56472 / CBS 6340 / NRRL Y-8284) TaxID=559295 RepID=C5DB86_LACTC|nr:KLTH0A00528p [Lachancea thermotolerans CBS 6340]XP_021220087.1 KLTH0E00220p [Lachancea thermotolerans CBS 6340]CAR21043.1 KLTH0A00528p [Lachancea thermotolerans CBS 6340]CAR23062.1 KLTH0E00220p [Lachancea thermotolerans CBS 6340]